MKSIINIIEKNITIGAVITDIENPKDIWNNIKNDIKNLYLNVEDNVVTANKLLYYLLGLDDFELYTDDNKVDDLSIRYDCTLDCDDKEIVFKVQLHNDSEPCIFYTNKIIIDPNNEGNCIDSFLLKGIKPQLDLINTLIKSIKKRLPQRQHVEQYHMTGCYEKDFTEISLIKNFAQKIVDNCNIHLERISENYTKLN